ncbi:methyltransferase domain-containing protein [Aromatoleum diolicum]|uniref:Arsenite methyltransferase n=1 Tax=Aromatoleum diolicum TaxID=75796 RepID=A0ABX1QFZ7_9RHOO|nr:methyltransferase domain-containing protein [Aromatoleum diolicum]NMG76430.1 methyltransferase domain-containing protein [Aromatoleum diolicum]
MATDALRPLVRKAYADAATKAAAVVPGKRPLACTPHSGLGCGSPTTIAGLTPGDWVLDLGCGAGFDCLAAAVEVGRRGRVVGVDMTPEMVRLASRHARDADVPTVSFVQAEIESLPFPDASFDVVMSNCVINLCADKQRIFAEAWRVLKPGGRLAVADIVAVALLPVELHGELALHTGCVAGATALEGLAAMLREAGFASAEIAIAQHGRSVIDSWAPGRAIQHFVAAANITATKQARDISR